MTRGNHVDQHWVGVHFVADSESKTGVGPSCRWHKEAGCCDVRALAGWPSWAAACRPKKEERRRERATGALGWQREEDEASWARSLGREKMRVLFLFLFFYFSSILNPFQMNLNSLLKSNKTKSIQHKICTSMNAQACILTLMLILFL